jgi:hypothetical protein
VEEKIEQLCLTFERLKPYLRAHWNGPPPESKKSAPSKAPAKEMEKEKEVSGHGRDA